MFGIAIFMYLEGWNFIDSFYFTVSAITTVGFGDIVPTNTTSRFIATLYMILSVPLLLFSVGIVVEVVHDRYLSKSKLKTSKHKRRGLFSR
ncbi:two pore domain potassium channel family protein [Patescibacteria group bacterium]|nr:two pore domain potassium channel family protein [Patescibacteria group bacterium]